MFAQMDWVTEIVFNLGTEWMVEDIKAWYYLSITVEITVTPEQHGQVGILINHLLWKLCLLIPDFFYILCSLSVVIFSDLWPVNVRIKCYAFAILMLISISSMVQLLQWGN